MVIIVQEHNASRYTDLMDQMFRLRARVFAQRLGWDVEVSNGRERDKYDCLGPVYLIHTGIDGKQVRASLRVLPTTGPTLLSGFFSDTVPAGLDLRSPHIWECTRVCIDDDLHVGERDKIHSLILLLEALGDMAVDAGIHSFVGNFDSSTLQLYRRLGCDVDVIGSTERYGAPVYLGYFPVRKSTISRLRARREQLCESPRLSVTRSSNHERDDAGFEDAIEAPGKGLDERAQV